MIFADWKPAGAIQYPRSLKLLVDDKPMMEMSVTEARVNPEFAADLFKKPAE